MGEIGVLEAEVGVIPEAIIYPNPCSLIGAVADRYFHELMSPLARGEFPFFQVRELRDFLDDNSHAFRGNKQVSWTYHNLMHHLNMAVAKTPVVRKMPESIMAEHLASALYQQVSFLDSFFLGNADYESTRKRTLDKPRKKQDFLN